MRCNVPRASAQQIARRPKWRAEASLVVEGQLCAAGFAHRNHPLCLLKRWRHWFFAVNGAHTGFCAGNDHFGMEVGPGADADNIETFLCQHLTVVLIHSIAAVLLLKRPCMIEIQVCQRYQVRIRSGAIPARMHMRHAKPGCASGTPGFTGADNTNPIHGVVLP
jgi:hypothetical protein